MKLLKSFNGADWFLFSVILGILCLALHNVFPISSRLGEVIAILMYIVALALTANGK